MSAAITCSNAANYVVSNLATGSGTSDTLFQSSGAVNAPLLNGGIVSIGYFSSNAYIPSSDLSMIGTTIGAFTIVDFALTGSFSNQLDVSGAAGYVDKALFDGTLILTGNPLIGRTVYLFAGNGATLAASNAFALQSVGVIVDEESGESQFSTNPTGQPTPVIGQINVGAFSGNPFPTAGAGTTTFNTLQLTAIPEPSTLLLSALGVLALLRRKR